MNGQPSKTLRKNTVSPQRHKEQRFFSPGNQFKSLFALQLLPNRGRAVWKLGNSLTATPYTRITTPHQLIRPRITVQEQTTTPAVLTKYCKRCEKPAPNVVQDNTQVNEMLQPSPSTQQTQTTTHPTIPVPGSSRFNNECARLIAVQSFPIYSL